jgi:hypothetical protein
VHIHLDQLQLLFLECLQLRPSFFHLPPFSGLDQAKYGECPAQTSQVKTFLPFDLAYIQHLSRCLVFAFQDEGLNLEEH